MEQLMDFQDSWYGFMPIQQTAIPQSLLVISSVKLRGGWGHLRQYAQIWEQKMSQWQKCRGSYDGVRIIASSVIVISLGPVITISGSKAGGPFWEDIMPNTGWIVSRNWKTKTFSLETSWTSSLFCLAAWPSSRWVYRYMLHLRCERERARERAHV